MPCTNKSQNLLEKRKLIKDFLDTLELHVSLPEQSFLLTPKISWTFHALGGDYVVKEVNNPGNFSINWGWQGQGSLQLWRKPKDHWSYRWSWLSGWQGRINKGCRLFESSWLIMAQNKLQFQLALGTSGSQILPSWASLGFLLQWYTCSWQTPSLISCPWDQWKWKVPCAEGESTYNVTWTTGRHFFELWIICTRRA